MKTKLLLAIFCSLMLSACNEARPWTDSLRFGNADTEVLYQAPADAGEAIEAAWFPQAAIALDDTRILYAAQGTRKLIELDTVTKQQTVLFDLAAWEPELNRSEAFDSTWGEALIKADAQWLVVASAQRALLWVNLQTGEVKPVGNTLHDGAHIPEDGVQLKDVDFSLFSGIERSDKGFYLVLGNQIFEVPWAQDRPESLLDEKLELIAGTLNERSDDPHDARGSQLRFSTFTHFAKYKGYLCFWTPPALRAVKDGRIFIITGFGYTSPNGDLESFYAQGLPQAPELVTDGEYLYTPYWSDESAILKMRVDHLDEESVQGSLDLLYPDAATLNQITPLGNDLLSVDTAAGAFWRISTNNGDARLLFGPMTAQARFESISSDPDSPYEPDAILGPMSVVTWQRGASALIYSPTVERLSMLSLSSGEILPFYQGKIKHLVSDARNRVWFSDYQTLYFLALNKNSELELSYVSQFFKRPNVMGVPCKRKILALTETPNIYAVTGGLYLHVPETGRVFYYERQSDELSVVHENGWVDPETSTQFYKAGMPTPLIEHWNIHEKTEAVVLNKNGKQYLFVGNLNAKSRELAGKTVSPNQFVSVSLEGLGDSQITAIAVSPDDRVVISMPGKIMQTDRDGAWQEVAEPCRFSSSDIVSHLEVYGQDDKALYLAQIGNETRVCASDGMHTGWQKLGLSHQIRLCGNAQTVVSVENEQLCTHPIDLEQSKKCSAVLSNFEVRDLTCDNNNIYLSGTNADGDSVIRRAPVDKPEKLADFMGLGAGYPDAIALKDALLGYVLGKMAMDAFGRLYFWMRDTCTIWRLNDREHIEADSQINRVLTDDRLCSRSGVFAVSPTSEVAFADGKTLYVHDGRTFENVGMFRGEVIELEAMGTRYVAMTTEGIEVWQDGQVSLAVESPVQLDGKDIDFAVRGDYHPRMVQAPGENAVIVPVYQDSLVLKLSL